MKSNKTKAAALALLLFGLGVAVGVLSQRYINAREVSAKTAEDYRHKYVSEMQTKLKLSTHQVDQVQVILDDTKAKVKAVRDSYRPEIAKVKAAQVTKVKAILTPEQAKQYEALVAEREQHAKDQDEQDQREAQRQREAHLKALAGH